MEFIVNSIMILLTLLFMAVGGLMGIILVRVIYAIYDSFKEDKDDELRKDRRK